MAARNQAAFWRTIVAPTEALGRVRISELASRFPRAFAPLRPLAGGEGGARRASDGRVRWVAPQFGAGGFWVPPAVQPLRRPAAPHAPPPPGAERGILRATLRGRWVPAGMTAEGVHDLFQPTRDRLRTRPVYRRPARSQARGRNRAAQPLATPAAQPRAA